MTARMRSRGRRVALAALVLTALAGGAGPLSGAAAGSSKRTDVPPAEPVKGSAVIASNAPSSSTVYDTQLLPSGRPGFYLVYTSDRESIPIYWMPSGTAPDAPSEIQDTLAYRSATTDPELNEFDTLIYAKGVAASIPTDSSSARKTSAADCWGGWSCLFGQQEWGGIILRFADEGYWQNMALYNFNNQASSLYNNKDSKSTVYATDPDGGGSSFYCLFAGQALASLNAFWNDNISSMKIKQNNVC